MAGANELGEAFVRIRPRTDGFKSEAEAKLKPAAKEVGDSVSQQLTEAITAGAFVAFAATVVNSAAQAEQAVGGVGAVFKDSAGQIEAFAAGAAESLGLTEQATLQFASQIGSALKGYGFSIEDAADTSEKLITKGADLTALFGGTVPEAVTAMSAALRGEFDPLERYGISLTAAAVSAKAVELGLAKSKDSVDGHAKAVATLAIIEAQTADATGQFAREVDTAAGQMSIASAKFGDARDELGSRFLPVVSKAAGAVSVLADGFGALPGPVQAAVAGMVALVALSGPLGRVKDAGMGVVDTFKEGGTAATEFRGKLSALAKTGVIVAGLAAITGGIQALKDETKEQGDTFAKSLPDVSDVQGYRDAVNVAVERQNFLSDELNKFNNNDFSKVPEGLGAAWDFFASSITGNVSEVGKLKAEYDALTSALPAAKARAEELTDKVNDLGDGLGITGVEAAGMVKQFKGLDITQVPMGKLVDVLSRLKAETIDVETAAELLGVGVSTAGDKAADAAKKLDATRDSLFGLVDASNAYTDSVQGVADAEANRERATRTVADAQRSYEAAVRSIGDAQDAYQDSVRATQDAEERRIQSLGDVEDATQAVIDAQRRLDEALNGPTESDNLDLEAAKLRLEQQKQRLGDITDPTERRLAEIDIRRAEIDLAERQAEIDARAGVAAGELTDAQDRLTEAQHSADDAARAVTDARNAERDATQGITDANYNAQKAAQAVHDADVNAEKASRDVERAKYDQLKASENLRLKLDEEAIALQGANAEMDLLESHFRNLIALHPELASAIQPLLTLLALARVTTPGTGPTVPTRENPDQGAAGGAPAPAAEAPPADDPGQNPRRGEPRYPWRDRQIVQNNTFNGVMPEEGIAVANQRLAATIGW